MSVFQGNMLTPENPRPSLRSSSNDDATGRRLRVAAAAAPSARRGPRAASVRTAHGDLLSRLCSHLTIDGRSTIRPGSPWRGRNPTLTSRDARPEPRLRPARRCSGTMTICMSAADMEEPDVWGTLMTRDSVIFHDNDFEVFIDPDGDNHEYYEFEINALNTEWDLLLVRPDRDGGPAKDAWEIPGLKTAVDVIEAP